MKQRLTPHIIGWIIIVFLGISDFFFKERMSFFTSGFSGLIFFLVGLALVIFTIDFKKISFKKN